MEIKRFAEKIERAVATVLGEEYEVKLQEVQKNNGVLLQGLIITRKSQNVSPTIYLQPFWEAYEGGVTLTELVRRIVQIYREDTPMESVDMSFFREFEMVKERICYRLINGEANAELLKKIPHVPFLDLAICFYYAYESSALGKGSILIHNSHVELWDTTTAELMELARENTPRLFPWECGSMEVVVQELMKEPECRGEIFEDKELKFIDMPMYILGNQQRIHGAASVLYPGLLEIIGEKLGVNFYILPSSVHEVILLADTGKESPKELKNMISEVNLTQVDPEEVLSYSLYYFDRKVRNIKVI